MLAATASARVPSSRQNHFIRRAGRFTTKLALVAAIGLSAGFAADQAQAQSCDYWYQMAMQYYRAYQQASQSGSQTQRNAANQYYQYAMMYYNQYQSCLKGGSSNNGNSNSNSGNSSNSNAAFRKKLEENAKYYRDQAIRDLMKYKAKNGYWLQYYLAPAYAGQNYMGPYYKKVSKWEATREINRIANNLGVSFVVGDY
jgi:hypothetical protein